MNDCTILKFTNRRNTKSDLYLYTGLSNFNARISKINGHVETEVELDLEVDIEDVGGRF
jgi:hypothetical protein